MKEAARRIRAKNLIGVFSVTAAFGFAVAGCSPSDKKEADSAPAISTQSAKVAVPQPVAPSAAIMGAPDSDTAATRRTIEGLVFNDMTGALEDDFNCRQACGSLGFVHLQIIPEPNSGSVDWVNAITDNTSPGYFIAKITNIDRRGVRMQELDIKKDEVVYEWVGQIRKNSPKRGVAFYKLDKTTGISKPMEATTQAKICKDTEYRGKPKVATHRPHPDGDCQYVGVNLAALKAKAKAGNPYFPLDGLWTSCSNGCCEIQGGLTAYDSQQKLLKPKGS